MNKSEARSKSMLLISNMYPSESYPFYGTFIKNFHDISQDYFDVDKVVLTKATSKMEKLIGYIVFYFKIVFNILFKKYDIVYVHYISHVAIPLLICKKIKKFNLYINVHGSDVVPTSNFGGKLLPYTASILKKAQRVIVPSSYFESLVKDEFKVDETIIRVYASGGINENIFFNRNKEEKEKILERFNLDRNKRYIGFASRIDTYKGWEVLIEAINFIKQEKEEYLDKYKFIIVGQGKDYNSMLEMIDEYNISEYVVLIDLLPQEKLAEIYSIIDWFVFPSYRKAESLGLVGIEAMACGTPVIASNMAGPTTYVENGINGFLFEPRNSKELYKIIINCINMDNKEYLSIQKQCLYTSTKYTSESIMDTYKKIFDKGVL